MPFGYTKYLEKQGKSPETIKGYIKTITMFFQFIDLKYGKAKEIHEINPKDIKDFLKYKLDSGNEIKTVNKNLTVLKGLFDYLWKIGKAPIDPAVKIKRLKDNDNEKPNIITYEMLLDALDRIIKNPDYSVLRKCIFILAMKGIRFSDYQLKKGNVIDKGDTVELHFKKITIALDGIEAEIFLRHFIDSQFNNSDYVFITKKRRDGTIVPVEVMSIHMHLNAITEDYAFPEKLTLNLIRHCYAYYLYSEKRMVIEEIATVLGIEDKSAAVLIKNSRNRHKKGRDLLELECKDVVK